MEWRRIYGYLRSGEEPIETTIVGGFLWYFGTFLAVPAILVMGYLMRVVRGIASGDPGLPVFDRWRELFVDGLKAYVIVGVYISLPFLNGLLLQDDPTQSTAMLLAFVVVLTGGGIFAILIPFGLRAGTVALDDISVTTADSADSLGVEQMFGVEELLVQVIKHPSMYALLLLVWFVLPAALANFARTGTLLSGFEFPVIRRAIRSPLYAIVWLVFFPLWWFSAVWWILPVFADLSAAESVADRGLALLIAELGSLLVVGVSALSFLLLLVAFAILGATWNTVYPADDGAVPETTTGTDDT